MFRTTAFIAALAMVLAVPTARADEFVEFESAKNAFEAGQYGAAVERFEALKKSQPKNKGIVEETHKLLAISYLFLGERTEAEKCFIELLSDNPKFALDPLVFPIDVVDFFAEVKNRHGERLAALSAARVAEEEAKRAAEERQNRLEMEKRKRNVYLGREVEKRSTLVALMPFGAGQFQNGHRVKGTLFLAGELLLTASAVTTFALHARLRTYAANPIESPSERESYEHLEKGFRIANLASIASLGALAICGIIDSLFFLRKETVSWRSLDEREVPSRLKPRPIAAAIAPFAAPGAVGISARAEF